MYYPHNVGLRRLANTNFAQHISRFLPTMERAYKVDDPLCPDPHVCKREFKYPNRRPQYAFVIRSGVLCHIPMTINHLLGTNFDQYTPYLTVKELGRVRRKFIIDISRAICASLPGPVAHKTE